jgi:hypothetical protein
MATGNPVFKEMNVRRAALLSWTTDDDAKAVWSGIVRDAKGGDPVARKLFCDYIFGKPVQAIELSSLSGEEASTELGRFRMRLSAFAGRLSPDQRYELAAFLADKSAEDIIIEPGNASNGPADGNGDQT